MEVFIRGVPQHSTERSLNTYFKDIMKQLDIEDWTCQKFGKGDLANIVFLNPSDGIKFHNAHGQTKNSSGSIQLQVNGRPIKCTYNQRALNILAVKSLEYERKSRLEQASKSPKKNTNEDFRKYTCESIHCGIWDHRSSGLFLQNYFQLKASAKLDFKSRRVSFEIDKSERLDIAYTSIDSLARDNHTLIFTLRQAPRSSRVSEAYTIGPAKRKRVSGLNEDHEKVSGSCLVYQIILSPTSNLNQKLKSLGQIRGLPPLVRRSVPASLAEETYAKTMKRLLDALSPATASLPFPARFQLQRLAQNGYLSPNSVLLLIPKIRQIFKRSGELITTAVIRKLFRNIPFAGPDVEPEQFSSESLVNLLHEMEAQVRNNGDSTEGVRSSDQVAVIHKAHVTPTGIYLYGPDAESNNRVLRKYSKHHDFFLRVQFIEEDGSQVLYSRTTSNECIFQRFKQIMNNGIDIAGQRYSFLGFSHSSLRSQSCWFMAPFVYEGSLLLDRQLIRGLGNFSQIRCPARCAARIGQAFSDTRETITLPPNIAEEIPDVERNGRVFSDGVGTISQQALNIIWDGLSTGKKPTVIQIRYQGAKGMIALDSRLQGTKMCLRNSMTKFRGSDSTDLEICTAGYQPIKLYLNEQIIPILENLGVSNSWFLDLQRQEIERLSLTTSTAKKAAKFLASHSIGGKIKLPWFIERLPHLKLAFQQDEFLTRIVEAAVLVQLRTLKYKARIPVRQGFTLLGILDETGILNEGQVFCIADVKGISTVIASQFGEEIIVTRSPALHPGDVQTAVAVKVPNSSPLMKLRNCIVFSQRGPRDLPSMLSGGDLDGDLYHIIFDRNARLSRPTFTPADYPRQPPRELDRIVERSDMTDFFVEFMEIDQLGRICNMHKTVADQSTQGVADPQCITLAEMASTAVDFSKTGIPVDMKKLQALNFTPIRPHFMAPGPYVEILKHKPISFDRNSTGPDEGPDDDDEFQGYKYYTSTRILGKLFDAVDEHEIFSQLKENSANAVESITTQQWDRSTSLLQHIWEIIRFESQKTNWEAHIARARGIRDEYEDSIIDLMYEYGPSPHLPLSEVEVFIGSILGTVGAPTSRQRDMAMSMKERFEEIMSSTIGCITAQDELSEDEGDGSNNVNESNDEGLSVGTACLWVNIHDGVRPFGDGKVAREGLKSFGYVAAALTLKLLDRLERF